VGVSILGRNVGRKEMRPDFTQFLSAFTTLQKAAISLVMFVHLSICTQQLGSHWMDFNDT
jgi:hypothetical protein